MFAIPVLPCKTQSQNRCNSVDMCSIAPRAGNVKGPAAKYCRGSCMYAAGRIASANHFSIPAAYRRPGTVPRTCGPAVNRERTQPQLPRIFFSFNGAFIFRVKRLTEKLRIIEQLQILLNFFDGPIPPLDSQKRADHLLGKPVPDEPGRHAPHNRIWLYVLCHNCAGSYHGAVPNFHSGKDDDVLPQPYVISYLD